ncbi:MAG: GNAT family N-acetyltransferase [Bacteroidota bacterium]
MTIRFATTEDMPAIHDLVQELALFEKAPEQVETTAEIYAADFSANQPAFHCLVAEHETDGIVGIALFYFGYSTWKGRLLYLDDLVIRESHRRQGIGSQLMEALLAHAKEKQVRQMRWQVLDWNDPAIQMYQKMGAKIEGEWMNCSLSYQQLNP